MLTKSRTADVNVADELEEIREQMAELLRMAKQLVRGVKGGVYQRAEAYWMAHIASALGDMGYSTHATTMADTINELHDLAYPEEEDEY